MPMAVLCLRSRPKSAPENGHGPEKNWSQRAEDGFCLVRTTKIDRNCWAAGPAVRLSAAVIVAAIYDGHLDRQKKRSRYLSIDRARTCHYTADMDISRLALAPHIDTTPLSTTIYPDTSTPSLSTDWKSSSHATAFLDSNLGDLESPARGMDVHRRATTIFPTIPQVCTQRPPRPRALQRQDTANVPGQPRRGGSIFCRWGVATEPCMCTCGQHVGPGQTENWA